MHIILTGHNHNAYFMLSFHMVIVISASTALNHKANELTQTIKWGEQNNKTPAKQAGYLVTDKYSQGYL